MRSLTIALYLTILLFSCKSQNTTVKEFDFPQLGWKIQIPYTFTIMDSTQIELMNNKGLNAIESTYDTTIDFKPTKTLFSITKGKYNFFASTITPFDPQKDGDWDVSNATLKNVFVETFRTQAPSSKIDTSSSVENIDGLEFQKFHVVTTYPNKLVMNTFMYSRLYKGFDFGINMSYTDDKIGKELMDMLKSSKFVK